jgi:hypothetical protein
MVTPSQCGLADMLTALMLAGQQPGVLDELKSKATQLWSDGAASVDSSFSWSLNYLSGGDTDLRARAVALGADFRAAGWPNPLEDVKLDHCLVGASANDIVGGDVAKAVEDTTGDVVDSVGSAVKYVFLAVAGIIIATVILEARKK